jgi:hypothetical protein
MIGNRALDEANTVLAWIMSTAGGMAFYLFTESVL